MSQQYTTELSAINSMLATIGEAPINSVTGTGLTDVAVASQALDEALRSVLVDGWAFNTDNDYPMTPQAIAPNEIFLPPNAMVVLPSKEYAHITPRGNRLYNTQTYSYSFTGHPAVPCQVIWAMDFADLPEVTRQYIGVRACRLFQARTTASELLNVFTEKDEQQARWVHTRNNVRVRRKNLLFDSASVRRIHLNR